MYFIYWSKYLVLCFGLFKFQKRLFNPPLPPLPPHLHVLLHTLSLSLSHSQNFLHYLKKKKSQICLRIRAIKIETFDSFLHLNTKMGASGKWVKSIIGLKKLEKDEIVSALLKFLNFFVIQRLKLETEYSVLGKG